MGLLSTAAKLGKTVGKITDDLPVHTKPKRDINPLIKQTEEIFQSPDVRPQYLSQESILKRHSKDEAIYEYDEDIIGTMYSPVYSAIENMPIGKKGTKGENISAYLNKRAPNVDKAELESFDINLDPNKRYTREEVLALAKEKGSADYTIEKQKYVEFDDMQRQNVKDGEVEYIELTVQGKQEYTGDDSYVHLGGTNNIGHTRSSIRRKKMGFATDKEMPVSQKITDRDVYLLVEEMQSDLAKVRNNPELNLDTDVDIDTYTDIIRADFGDLKDALDIDYNISVDNDVLGTVRTFYEDLFNPYTIDSLKDIENINADDTYRKLLITKIKTYHNNLDVAGKDLDTVALDAIRKTSDTSRGEINYSSDGDFEFDPEESLEREVKSLLSSVRNQINALYDTKAKQKSVKKVPVASRTDYVKRLLLANIAYAKQNNINKIVIPSYKEIAKQRIDSFDDLAMSDSLPPAVLKKYNKALKDDTVGELAQEYYEGVFKPIYEDSVNKVLNSLKKETKGAIKTKPKKLEYLDASTHPKFRTSDALEIDITDFNYDPTKQGLRFNEGGSVTKKPIDTGRKTVTGRTIWRDPETGQDYSERSTTFEIDGVYYTMPTVAEDGSQYTDDQIIDYVKKYGASDYLTGEELPKFKTQEGAIEYAISRSDTRKQKEPPIMEQQMKQFNEGGLLDEGGQVDEVSGNEVPIGGTRKGVRDDVPAMISEGEFIFPEDVTRYIGLDKLMQLRQEAKMGLKRMEAMGQMGNSDEATIPDDMPFSMADLIIVGGDTGEELEMNEGGVAPEFSSVRRLSPVIERPEKQDLSFKTIMGDSYYQVKMFKNAEGVTTFIGFVGDNPVYPIPEGFTLYDPTAEGATDTEETETVEEVNEVLSNVEPRDPKSPFKDNRSEFTQKGSWSNSSLNDYINEAKKFTNGSSSIATAVASLGGPLMAGLVYNFSNKEKQNILSTIDARMKGASPEQLTELKNIKGILEKKLENKSILGKIKSFVGNLFAPDEVKQKISNDAAEDAGVVIKPLPSQKISGPKKSEIAGKLFDSDTVAKQTTSAFPARLEMNSMEVSPPTVNLLGQNQIDAMAAQVDAIAARQAITADDGYGGFIGTGKTGSADFPADVSSVNQTIKPTFADPSNLLKQKSPYYDTNMAGPKQYPKPKDVIEKKSVPLPNSLSVKTAEEQATAILEANKKDPYTYPTSDITAPVYKNKFKEMGAIFGEQPRGTTYKTPYEKYTQGIPQGTLGQRMGTVGFKDTSLNSPVLSGPALAEQQYGAPIAPAMIRDTTYNPKATKITVDEINTLASPQNKPIGPDKLQTEPFSSQAIDPMLDPRGRNQIPTVKQKQSSLGLSSSTGSYDEVPTLSNQTESAFPSGRPSIDTAPEGTGISDASLQSTLLDTGVSLRPRARPTDVSVAGTTAAPSTETRASRTSTTSGVSAANAAAALREEMAAVSDDRRREIERTTASGYTGSTVNGVATGQIAGNGQVQGVVTNEDGKVKKTDNGMTVFKDSNGVEYVKPLFGEKQTLDGEKYTGPADAGESSDNNTSSNSEDSGGVSEAWESFKSFMGIKN